MANNPICERCHRPILFPVIEHRGPCDTGITAYVVHENYGCDTACCGHAAYLLDANENIVASDFYVVHPRLGVPHEAFIRDLIHDRWPWVTIDYAKCEVLND